MNTDNRITAAQKGADLLARREHSRAELRRKLSVRGYNETEIESALAYLARSNLQSDIRFAEIFARSRYQRGQGPRKVAAALREKGVEDKLARRALYENNLDWQTLAAEVYAKKYPGDAASAAERAKRGRFLRQRGFSDTQIRAVLREAERKYG